MDDGGGKWAPLDTFGNQTSVQTSLENTMSATKTVGAYEAKTTLPALLDFVARGREVVITKHERPIARLIPVTATTPSDRDVFIRMRRLRGRISLPKGETARDLIEAGRRL